MQYCFFDPFNGIFLFLFFGGGEVGLLCLLLVRILQRKSVLGKLSRYVITITLLKLNTIYDKKGVMTNYDACM